MYPAIRIVYSNIMTFGAC